LYKLYVHIAYVIIYSLILRQRSAGVTGGTTT